MSKITKKTLRDLPNIGLTLLKKLEKIDIYSVKDLKKVGPDKAYIKLCQLEGKRLPVCYYLYSLYGALEDKNWRSLSENEKKALLAKVKY